MRIRTPKSSTVKTGACTATLTWAPDFSAKWEERYVRAQKFVDSEVIRLCAPYTPFDTGSLSRSANLGTAIGSGEVVWNAPYARYLYYGTLMVSPSTGSPWAKKGERKVQTGRELRYVGAPKRGKLWFERMKADHKQEILDGARRIIGGGR